jgi:hypothetical protein
MLLQNMQAEFAEVIFSEEEQTEIISPAQNMVIYRNNMLSNLSQTLVDTYPMITKLLGEDYFRLAAKSYIEAYPSRSSNLHDYGEYFSDFLSEYLPLKNLPYLAEVAEFEWACHLLYFAADCPALNLESLAQVSDQDYHQLHFSLHPASRLMKFHYPILRIVDLCKGINDKEINLNEGGVNLLLLRPESEIMLVPLSLADFTFLTALQDNQTLAQALTETMQIDANFDIEKNLPAFVQDKILTAFYN